MSPSFLVCILYKLSSQLKILLSFGRTGEVIKVYYIGLKGEGGRLRGVQYVILERSLNHHPSLPPFSKVDMKMKLETDLVS